MCGTKVGTSYKNGVIDLGPNPRQEIGGHLTPNILKLVEQAIQDGRISATRVEDDAATELSRLTPVVLQLVEDAINDGRKSGDSEINSNANGLEVYNILVEKSKS